MRLKRLLHLLILITTLMVAIPMGVTHASSSNSQQSNAAGNEQSTIPPSPPPAVQARAQALVNQGIEARQLKQYDKAVDLLRQAVAMSPDWAIAHLQLGAALIETQQPTEALSEMRRAVALAPDNYETHFGLGNALHAMQRYADAIAALKESIRLNPQYFWAYNNLGLDYSRIDKPKEAVEAFQHALQIEPNNVSARSGLGYAYLNMGKKAEGIEELRQVVRLNSNPNSHVDLARVYQEQGMYEEAGTEFSEVIRLAPRFPLVRFERSVINLYLGEGEAAATDALKFLDLTNWHNNRSQYAVIVAALGYEQESGMSTERAKVLDEAEKLSDTGVWPYPVIKYLRGELSEQELLALANDNDKLTEAHAYIGAHLMNINQKESALIHLRWVEENGNRRFVEYPLAKLILKRSTK